MTFSQFKKVGSLDRYAEQMIARGSFGGLNLPAAARKSESLMASLLAGEGQLFFDFDATSLEPHIIAHYGKDRVYTEALAGGAPREVNGSWYTPSLYMNTALKMPLFHDQLMDRLSTHWAGASMLDIWESGRWADFVADTKPIVNKAKALTLGILYGMGAKRLQREMRSHGAELSIEETKGLVKAFWAGIPGAARVREAMMSKMKNLGYIETEFGYRMRPYDSHSAFNGFIQTGASGVMDYMLYLFQQRAPWARFVFLLHDELCFRIPEERLADTEEALALATSDLNRDLAWSVQLKFVSASGKTLFDIK